MRTRAMTEPSAGLIEASSPPDGLAIHSPSHAPELTGSISNRSRISFAVSVAVMFGLREPGESFCPGSKSAPGGLGPASHSFRYRHLKGGVVPFREIASAADAQTRISRRRAVLLDRADMQR